MKQHKQITGHLFAIEHHLRKRSKVRTYNDNSKAILNSLWKELSPQLLYSLELKMQAVLRGEPNELW